jgi:16S rRNA (adenine1518-N6/adenine1519-N6)-dimethyltransferase
VVLVVPDREARVPAEEWPALEAAVRGAFGQRRKMLRQALTAPGVGLTPRQIGTVLEAAGIDGRRRGETLTLEEFRRLGQAMAAVRAGARATARDRAPNAVARGA